MKIWQAGRLTFVHIDKRHLPWPVENELVCVCQSLSASVCVTVLVRVHMCVRQFIRGYLASPLACVGLHKCVHFRTFFLFFFWRVCVCVSLWACATVCTPPASAPRGDERMKGGPGRTNAWADSGWWLGEGRGAALCCSMKHCGRIGQIKTRVLLFNTLMKY